MAFLVLGEVSLRRKSGLLAFFFLCNTAFLFCDYPEIFRLSRDDIVFAQLQNDIESYHRLIAAGREEDLPALTIFQYRCRPEEDLLGLAARLNIPYDSIATLNGLDSADELSKRRQVLIANLPGVFAPLQPDSELGRLMLAWRVENQDLASRITILDTEGERRLLFFRGDRFHSLERAFFLRVLFRFPLPFGKLTSEFGLRRDPFDGHPQFHNGIDLGAPLGTDVYAAKDGVVVKVGSHPVLGQHILLSHEGGFQTLYGHLSEALVDLNDKVVSGMIVGSVGVSGRTTGPHLHFEIRRSGNQEDPLRLLPPK